MLCYWTKLYFNRQAPGVCWDSGSQALQEGKLQKCDSWLEGWCGACATWFGVHSAIPPSSTWVFLRAFPMQQTVADLGSHSSSLLTSFLEQ